MARRKTTEEFIKDARKVHGDKYDYLKTVYINDCTKVCIICSEHGEFWQTPNTHLSGQGCPKCGKVKKANSHRTSWLELISRFRKIHGDKYEYTETAFARQNDEIPIYCKRHKFYFKQRILSHLNGSGCPICSGSGKYTTEMFIIKSREIHGDKYNYSNVTYVNKNTKVEIICPVHGPFWQKPREHISGCGCPKCQLKEQSKIYEFLKESFPDKKWVWEYKATWLGRQRIDMCCPDIKLAIEYNGPQHYMPIKYFGGECGYDKTIERDIRKIKLCKEHDFKVYIIKYDNVNYNKIKEDITNILNNYYYEDYIK